MPSEQRCRYLQQMNTERLSIADLVEDPANARTHNAKNLRAIKGSLKRFGQQKPIVVDVNGIVVAGNGTLAAARELGWDTIDVVRTTLAGAEAIAYAIADNRSGELAAWDDEVLAKALAALDAEGWDLPDIGFDDDDWMKPKTEGTDGLIDPDEIPDQAPARTKRGDLWVLGEHRLLCGDSTSTEDVGRLMAGEKADMVFTDPPYGMNAVSKDGKVGGATARAPARTYRAVFGDEDTTVARDAYAILAALSIPKMFIWGGNYFTEFLPPSPCWIVWDKQRPDGLTFADGEVAWSNLSTPLKFVRHRWDGYHRASERNEDRVHPTQKPAFLGEWCFKEYGKEGDRVIDLFLGSGSTLIACEKTGRRCFGMEIDEHYCDVIVERWEKFTGKQARLDGE